MIVRFDRILEAVREGFADAGVVIHEGQLTYESQGLHKVADLGDLWKANTGCPLPLGLDVVRKDLGLDLAQACSSALRRSIEYAAAHREEAVAYALQYGRGLSADLGGRFVDMYVNDYTLDMGDSGRKALITLFQRAAEAGLLPAVDDLVLV